MNYQPLLKTMGVSKNRGTPKWMVYYGKPYQNGWFGDFLFYFWKHPFTLLGLPGFRIVGIVWGIVLYCWPSSIAERTVVSFGCGKKGKYEGGRMLRFVFFSNLRVFGCVKGFCLRFSQVVTKTVPSRKLTYPLKIDGWNMYLVPFQMTFVDFGGVICN